MIASTSRASATKPPTAPPMINPKGLRSEAEDGTDVGVKELEGVGLREVVFLIHPDQSTRQWHLHKTYVEDFGAKPIAELSTSIAAN